MPVTETAETFASHSVTRLLERLAFQINVTAHSHHADAIHDLRVALRRFDQALLAWKRLLPGREVKRIHRKLKETMRLSGSVRDCDIALKLLAGCALPEAAAVREAVAEHRKAAVPVLAAALRRWGVGRTSSKWRCALASNRPADGFETHLPKLARKFLAHGKSAASGKASAEDLHRFRIEAKKFRYTLELFQPLYGAPLREWLARLKPVQTVLGDIHDRRMARALAAHFEGTPEIDGWLKKKQRRKTREFRRLWEATFGTPADNRLRVESLRRSPRKPMGRSTLGSAAMARGA